MTMISVHMQSFLPSTPPSSRIPAMRVTAPHSLRRPLDGEAR